MGTATAAGAATTNGVNWIGVRVRVSVAVTTNGVGEICVRGGVGNGVGEIWVRVGVGVGVRVRVRVRVRVGFRGLVDSGVEMRLQSSPRGRLAMQTRVVRVRVRVRVGVGVGVRVRVRVRIRIRGRRSALGYEGGAGSG